MSAPFFKADPRAWAIAAEILPKPWPRELVEMDLAWWQDQVAVGKQARIPGHVTMQARWGWSERAARAALRALSVPPPSRERTAAVPPPSRAETDGGQQSAKSVPPPSRERTAAVPSASNTRGSPEPRAQSPEIQTPEPPAEPPAAPEVDQPQQAAVTQPKPAKGAQDTANVMAAYRVWREVTPARKAAPSVGETRVMLQRIRQDGATVEDLAVVFRWAATSDETYPRQIRGEAPWHDGECKRHLSIETLCKAERWTKRLEEARAWSEGRAIVQQAAERPWETPGTGSPYRTGSPELVREWVTLNAAEVDRVRAAIRQAGKGWAELAQWLASRVTDPEAVLREIRRPVLQGVQNRSDAPGRVGVATTSPGATAGRLQPPETASPDLLADPPLLRVVGGAR